MPIKAVVLQEEDIDERVVYSVYFKCPYCNYGNDLEWVYICPDKCKCVRCDKIITIKIDKNK
jgi:hypothetical protein